MSLSINPEYSDVFEDNYVSGTLSVSNGVPQIAKVGANNLVGREMLVIYNPSDRDFFYGPSGVTSTTGVIIPKDSTVYIPVGDKISIYVVPKDGNNKPLVVQEWA